MNHKYLLQIISGIFLSAFYCVLIYLRLGFETPLMLLTIIPGSCVTIGTGLYMSKERHYLLKMIPLGILFVFSSYIVLQLVI